MSLYSQCSSAFRRTPLPSLYFLHPRQSRNPACPISTQFSKDLSIASPSSIKTSAQGFPMYTDWITRMIHPSFTGTQPWGKVCLQGMVNRGWVFIHSLALLKLNTSIDNGRARAEDFLWTEDEKKIQLTPKRWYWMAHTPAN